MSALRSCFKRFKPAERLFKNLFLNVFALFLKKRAAESGCISHETIRKILVLRPERLGDTLVSFPLIDALRRRLPQASISILTSPRSLNLVKADPRFDKVFVYRKQPWRDLLMLFQMRKERFDCVIDMICGDSVTTLFLSALTAAGKPRVGMHKNKFAKYYEFSTWWPTQPGMPHIIDMGLELIKAFGFTRAVDEGYCTPYVDSKARLASQQFIDGIHSASGVDSQLVGYNFSAGAASRYWPTEKIEQLLTRIISTYTNVIFVLIATREDRPRALAMARALNGRAVVVPEHLTFLTASAIVSHLDLLITPDTSFVHIARGYRLPVLVLYPNDPRNTYMWHPYGFPEGAVYAKSARNIFDISVDDVYNRYRQLSPQFVENRT